MTALTFLIQIYSPDGLLKCVWIQTLFNSLVQTDLLSPHLISYFTCPSPLLSSSSPPTLSRQQADRTGSWWTWGLRLLLPPESGPRGLEWDSNVKLWLRPLSITVSRAAPTQRPSLGAVNINDEFGPTHGSTTYVSNFEQVIAQWLKCWFEFSVFMWVIVVQSIRSGL